MGIAASMTLMYQAVFSSGTFWLGLILIPSAALTRDIAWKAVKRTLFESLRERVMQMEKRNQDPGKIIPHDVEIRKSKSTSKSRNPFRSRDPKMEGGNAEDSNRGYAFSQEEHGVVSQSQMIRKYDSTVKKPEGN